MTSNTAANFYPGTTVFINKFQVRDAEKLKELEAHLTHFRSTELLLKPIEGSFDLKHLQNIHRWIFQDLYDWAGELRVVAISKTHLFCMPQFIREQADQLFQPMLTKLKSADDITFFMVLGEFYAEINVLHPFREGNGRAQRVFFSQLLSEFDFALKISEISRDALYEACISGFDDDGQALAVLLQRHCIKASPNAHLNANEQSGLITQQLQPSKSGEPSGRKPK